GAAGALNARTYGSTTAWVCACGRLYLPPSTWQILWCRADPADANAVADKYAAYRTCSRPGRPAGSAATGGRAPASARMPAVAKAAWIGSALGPQRESTQWARAFRPEATLMPTGSE